MGRLTVRLPDTLHHQLVNLAEQEGVSLNQYIVFALTRQTTLGYTVQAVPQAEVAQQQAAYAALLQNLGEATFDEIEAILDDTEGDEPEAIEMDVGLSEYKLSRLQMQIAGKTATIQN